MNSNNLIVHEYLKNLKEDKELDYLFPLLLNVMGFRLVQTAKESKGQSQYGKDIIAIGKDENGDKYRWYFELKGYKDRDITANNFAVPDGILDSIREAKFTAFNDSSIPEFNDLPIKIVVVHNGILKTNVRPTFEGFISREFSDGEFERWDIYHLIDLFSKYLFSEYLLLDNESNRLFKKVLAFLDAPDNDYSEFKQLIELQVEKIGKIHSRSFKKFFATINLLSAIILHYSKENNNLISAKECNSYIVLRVWSWILNENLESKTPVLKEFSKILKIQYLTLNEYFKKTYHIASLENGLFAENGGFFEAIGYPLRCFDYLNDLIYYCQLRHFFPQFSGRTKNLKLIRNRQKDKIIDLVTNNRGFYKPLIDNHSIPIVLLFLFFTDKKDYRQKDVDFIASYILGVINNIIIVKKTRGHLPELYNRINLVSEYHTHKKKPEEYCDQSSMLIAILLELLVIFDNQQFYHHLKKHLDENLSLQIAHPNNDEFDIEELMFKKHMHDEYYIESYLNLPDDFNEFKKALKQKKYNKREYRTDKIGFPFLRTLAHIHFKNEIFPDEWRRLIPKTKS